jgi:hypothetical protein
MSSNIGYYRIKRDNLSIGDNTISVLINGEAVSKTVRVKEICSSDMLLKYLNSKGQYRYYAFNRYYEQKDKITSLGKANKIVTDLLTSQSNVTPLGNRHERSMVLTADNVPADELLILKDLFVSPCIYLNINSITDTAKDWLQVEMGSTNFISIQKKLNFSKVTFEIILPEQYTLTLM